MMFPWISLSLIHAHPKRESPSFLYHSTYLNQRLLFVSSFCNYLKFAIVFSVQSKSAPTVPSGYPVLNNEVLNKLSAWRNINPIELVSTKYGRVIYGQDIQQFQMPVIGPGQTLIIAQWLRLVVAHHGASTMCTVGAHSFENLCDYSYNVQKPILKNHKVFLALYLDNRWVLAVIYPIQMKIVYYDPLNVTGDTNNMLLEHLANFVKAGLKKETKKEIDMSEWVMDSATDIPLQTKGNDSDVFVCAYAESLARNQRQFTFTESDMAYFRKRVCYSVGTGQILDKN